MQFAPGRAGALVAALDQRSEPHFVAAQARLEAWRRRARAQTLPSISTRALLGADGGRRALIERLGPEAADAIDEFMALALAHEREQAPSLCAFLDEVEAADTPVKRDMEARSDGVRVMTVHARQGARGADRLSSRHLRARLRRQDRAADRPRGGRGRRARRCSSGRRRKPTIPPRSPRRAHASAPPTPASIAVCSMWR